MYFGNKKGGFGKVMKNSAGCGIFVKKEGNRDQAPPLPFQTLVLVTRTQSWVLLGSNGWRSKSKNKLSHLFLTPTVNKWINNRVKHNKRADPNTRQAVSNQSTRSVFESFSANAIPVCRCVSVYEFISGHEGNRFPHYYQCSAERSWRSVCLKRGNDSFQCNNKIDDKFLVSRIFFKLSSW